MYPNTLDYYFNTCKVADEQTIQHIAWLVKSHIFLSFFFFKLNDSDVHSKPNDLDGDFICVHSKPNDSDGDFICVHEPNNFLILVTDIIACIVGNESDKVSPLCI